MKKHNSSYYRNRHAKAPWFNMYRRARDRATKKGVPFNITAQYIRSIWPTNNRCPVLDVPLRVSKGQPSDASPSLDRIVPKKGYVRGNVIIVCNKANTIKSHATVKEIWRVFRHYNNILNAVPLSKFKARRDVNTYGKGATT